MILLKAIIDSLGLFKLLPNLLVDVFWALVGIISIILYVVLFPVVVHRKYKTLKRKK